MDLRRIRLFFNSVLPVGGEAVSPHCGGYEFRRWVLESSNELVVSTIGFSGVDQCLETTIEQDGITTSADVRVECFTVLSMAKLGEDATTKQAVGLVAGAVEVLKRHRFEGNNEVVAQPGTLLADLSRLDGLRFRHAALVTPWVWGGSTPHVLEPQGAVIPVHDGDVVAEAVARLTLPLQVVGLHPGEYAYAKQYGVGRLPAIFDASGRSVMDPTRSDI